MYKKKKIPEDTPSGLKKELEKAIKNPYKGIEYVKSGLRGFATKYIVEGIPGLLSIEYFEKVTPQLRYFLKNNKNIKVRFILKCLMGIDSHEGKFRITRLDQVYIHF